MPERSGGLAGARRYVRWISAQVRDVIIELAQESCRHRDP
jgi:hypothetical protein